MAFNSVTNELITTPLWDHFPFEGIREADLSTLFYKGTFLVCGGHDTNKCWKYDLGTPRDAWYPGPDMLTVRRHPQVARMGSKLIVMGGGAAANGNPGLATSEIYDAERDEWKVGPNVPGKKGAQSFAIVIAISNYELFYSSAEDTNSFIYNFILQEWEPRTHQPDPKQLFFNSAGLIRLEVRNIQWTEHAYVQWMPLILATLGRASSGHYNRRIL